MVDTWTISCFPFENLQAAKEVSERGWINKNFTEFIQNSSCWTWKRALSFKSNQWKLRFPKQNLHRELERFTRELKKGKHQSSRRQAETESSQHTMKAA
jgi:hypothetical protein